MCNNLDWIECWQKDTGEETLKIPAEQWGGIARWANSEGAQIIIGPNFQSASDALYLIQQLEETTDPESVTTQEMVASLRYRLFQAHKHATATVAA